MGKATSRTRLAVTAGDPFGIGPEVALAAAQGLDADITFYGDPEFLPGAARVEAVLVTGERPKRPGPSAAGGRAALEALDRALEDIRAGRHDALVTAPLSKESCVLAGGSADGHTPILGRFFDVPDPLMAFVWDDREPVVALLTVHIPLRAVPASLTSERVEAAVRRLDGALRSLFGRAAPRIGSEVPLHATAVGKLHLAFAPGAVRTKGPLPRFTPRTRTTRKALAHDCARSRRRGWAENREEWQPGLAVVAAPVRIGDRLEAALALAAPAVRLPAKRTAAVARRLVAAAEEIAARLRGAT